MPRKFLGRGWRFPVAVDPRSGAIAMSDYEQDIKESIRIILATAKGERVMRPDFGCGIHDLVFDSINKATMGLVETSVREALTIWEPRVELLKLDISPDAATKGMLLVSIDYRVRETNSEFNLVYPFYLTEGSQ